MKLLILIPFVTVAAGTDDEAYAAWAPKGDWLIESAFFAPATPTAANGANYTTVSLLTNDGEGGAFASAGSFDTTAVALAVDTSREMTVSGDARKISEGSMLKLAKIDTAAGAVLHGVLTVVAEKVP